MPARVPGEPPAVRADGGDDPDIDRRRREILLRDPEIRANAAAFALLCALYERGDWLTADRLVEAVPAGVDVDAENVVSILWGLWNRKLVETRSSDRPAYRITESGVRTVERVEARTPDE